MSITTLLCRKTTNKGCRKTQHLTLPDFMPKDTGVPDHIGGLLLPAADIDAKTGRNLMINRCLPMQSLLKAQRMICRRWSPNAHPPCVRTKYWGYAPMRSDKRGIIMKNTKAYVRHPDTLALLRTFRKKNIWPSRYLSRKRESTLLESLRYGSHSSSFRMVL